MQETIDTRRQLQLIWGVIQRGQAKARDILAVDFGEWPLRGLDIALDQADKDVWISTPFKQALTSKNLWRPSSWKQFRTAWQEINNVWTKQRRSQGSAYEGQIKIYPAKGLLSDTLGHEAMHSLQRLVVDPEPQLPSNSKASIWNEHVGQEMNAILSMHESEAQTLQRRARYTEWINKGDHNADPTGPDYYKREVEIQARLHSLLAHGYRTTWRRMPASSGEFYDALEALGLDLPDSVSANRAVAGIFGKVKHDAYSWHTLNELKMGIAPSDFTPAQTEAVWKKLLPRLYGFLLEFYGDWQGRERMGAGTNPHRCEGISMALYQLMVDRKPIDWSRQTALFEKDPAALRHLLSIATAALPDEHEVKLITVLGRRFPAQTTAAIDQRMVKLNESLQEIQTGPQHNFSRHNENNVREFMKVYSDLRDQIGHVKPGASDPSSGGQVVDRAYFGFKPVCPVGEQMLGLPPSSATLELKADWFSSYGTLGVVEQVGRRVNRMLGTAALGGALVLGSGMAVTQLARNLFPQLSGKTVRSTKEKPKIASAPKQKKGFKRPAIAKSYTQDIKPPKVRKPLKNLPPSKSPLPKSKSHHTAAPKKQR